MSVFRSFPLGGTHRLEARVEATNVTNTFKFANPTGNVNSGDFMRIFALEYVVRRAAGAVRASIQLLNQRCPNRAVTEVLELVSKRKAAASEPVGEAEGRKPLGVTMRKSAVLAAMAVLFAFAGNVLPAAAQGAPLRIIAFGAHPDDNELRLAGTAAKWAALGHQVKFVAVTNGDIGHWREAGGPWPAGGPRSRWKRRGFSESPRRCSTSTTASSSRRSRIGARSPGSFATGRPISSSAIGRTTIIRITARSVSSFRIRPTW